MAIKYRQELGRPLTYAEGDENFRTLAESIEKTLAEYPTLTAALADDIPDGVVFLVNDGDDAGYWRRDSSLPEGAEFLREFGVTDQDFQEYKDDIDPRLWPEGKTLEIIDRPDLDFIYAEVDEDLRIINIYYAGGSSDGGVVFDTTYDRPDIELAVVDEDYRIIYLKKTEEVSPPTPTPEPDEGLVVDRTFDRPDLPFVVVDEDYYILFPTDSDSGQATEPAYEYVKKFWNPPPQPEFDVGDTPMVVDYGILVDAWDQLVEDTPNHPELEPYITKEQVGISTVDNLPILTYHFKPPNPKHKVLLLAGQHGHEKTYVKVLLDFMRTITTQWWDDPTLEWMRWNVEFTCIPALSPSTMSTPERPSGSRWIRETDPFPVSWTKSGNEVTISFDPSDFPDTNGRFVAEEYFLGQFNGEGIPGKVGVTITDSSDEAGLSNYVHRITEVVNGTTIKVEFDAGGASSGTATLGIFADSNRQAGTDEVWKNFDSGTSIMGNPTTGYLLYENKGIRPFSLAEAEVLRDVSLSGNFDIIINCHDPSQKHYLNYDSRLTSPQFFRAIDNIKYYASSFDTHNFDRIRPSIFENRFVRYLGNFGVRHYYIEWDGGQTVTSEQATGAMRWLALVVTQLLRANL